MGDEVEFDPRARGQFSLRRDWWRILRLAARQHETVARRQLLTLGVSRRQIDGLVASGMLHPRHRGVYTFTSQLSERGEWMAAVLAGGAGAVLSHVSAAIYWRLLEPRAAHPHVTTPAGGRVRPGIVFHTADLATDEMTIRDGIPITTISRTLFDLASVLDRFELELALAEAELHR